MVRPPVDLHLCAYTCMQPPLLHIPCIIACEEDYWWELVGIHSYIFRNAYTCVSIIQPPLALRQLKKRAASVRKS
jgi:hypothetical protein